MEEKTAELRQELELVQELRETQEVMREIQEMEQEQQPILGRAALATKKSQVKWLIVTWRDVTWHVSPLYVYRLCSLPATATWTSGSGTSRSRTLRQLSVQTARHQIMYWIVGSDTVHCTLYTVHCKLYTVHCTPYTVHCTLYPRHRTSTRRPWRQLNCRRRQLSPLSSAGTVQFSLHLAYLWT